MYSVELCAGAGGQAIGLEQAGFDHSALVEIDEHACATLRGNRPTWNVIGNDLANFDGRPFRGAELVAGGLPCPPFSKAGKQLGEADERNLFPQALRIIDEISPEAVMIENVRGLLDPVFASYRDWIGRELQKLQFDEPVWALLQASDFGVPQLRPRVVMVALKKKFSSKFNWPSPRSGSALTVGEALRPLMAANGWLGADNWAARANQVAPTIVGGSKKHGGPDLGPTRAKKAWAALGVNGMTIAEEAPASDFVGMPRLTIEMVARLQGFPPDWKIHGRKTHAYRQVGNAFPPPVAEAVASKIAEALHGTCQAKAVA